MYENLMKVDNRDIDEYKNIFQFLKKNEYTVQAQLQDNGCILHLPEKKFGETIQKQNIHFKILEDGVSFEIFTGIKLYNQQIFKMPKYAIRSYIIKDICFISAGIGYNLVLVDFYEHMNHFLSVKDFFDKIDSSFLDEEGKLLESELCDIIDLIHVEGFSKDIKEKAEKAGVLEGLNVILGEINND